MRLKGPEMALSRGPLLQLATRVPFGSHCIPLNLGCPVIKHQNCMIGKAYSLIYSPLRSEYFHYAMTEETQKTECR